MIVYLLLLRNQKIYQTVLFAKKINKETNMRKETVLKYTFEENQFYFTNRIDSALNKKTRKAKKRETKKDISYVCNYILQTFS